MARRECRIEEAVSDKEWALISYKQGSYPAQDPRRTLKLTFREERNHRLTPVGGGGGGGANYSVHLVMRSRFRLDEIPSLLRIATGNKSG